MIQQRAYLTTSVYPGDVNLNLVNGGYGNWINMVLNGYKPLISMKSMQSKKVRNFLPLLYNTDDWERFIYFTYLVFPASSAASENLENGIIYFGTEEYPFGLYEVNIYANTSTDNLNPAVLNRVWTGLCNVFAAETQNYPIYTEYEENDNDTNSIYITQ